MQKIETLIKVHKWNLDEKRQQLNDLKKLLNQLKQQELKIDEEFLREKELLTKEELPQSDFVNYHKLVNTRKETLHQSMDSIKSQIQTAEKEMLEAFQKLKKFELIKDNAIQKSKRKKEARLQKQFDEVGINQYLHKNK